MIPLFQWRQSPGKFVSLKRYVTVGHRVLLLALSQLIATQLGFVRDGLLFYRLGHRGWFGGHAVLKRRLQAVVVVGLRLLLRLGFRCLHVLEHLLYWLLLLLLIRAYRTGLLRRLFLLLFLVVILGRVRFTVVQLATLILLLHLGFVPLALLAIHKLLVAAVWLALLLAILLVDKVQVAVRLALLTTVGGLDLATGFLPALVHPVQIVLLAPRLLCIILLIFILAWIRAGAILINLWGARLTSHRGFRRRFLLLLLRIETDRLLLVLAEFLIQLLLIVTLRGLHLQRFLYTAIFIAELVLLLQLIGEPVLILFIVPDLLIFLESCPLFLILRGIGIGFKG